MDNKELTTQLVDKCLQKGADAAEVYLQEGRNLSIDIRNGEIEAIEESSFHGVGFRVFVEGKMAFSHCNEFSDKSFDNAIANAVSFAKNTTADENNVLPDNPGITEIEGLFDPEISRISMDDKIERAKNLEQLAMRDRRITKSAGAGYRENETTIFLANSHGISKNYKSSVCNYGVSVVAEKGDQKSSGSESCSRRFYADLKSPDEIAQKAARDAYEMLDPRMVRTQKAAVIFDPDVARAILGGIIGAINGERVLQGASFLRDKAGQKICSELITIRNDGTKPKGLASQPFDGEGIPTQKRTIVEKGILKGFMYNTIAAKRAGVESTGNAARGGFTSLPGIGPHCFYIEAGRTDPGRIIRSTRNGLYLKGVTGYGINPVNGNFSGGASGFWIRNGRLAFPVKGLTIAGTADEMLNGIDMVGNDLDLNRTLTAPTVRIRSMQIGGE